MTTNQQRTQLWSRIILIYCLVLLLVLIGFMLWENQVYEHALTTEEYTQLPATSRAYLINLNTATVEELQELPRIGPSLANEIIAYREANGPFLSKETLLEVKGIGQKTFDNLSALITI